MYRSVFDTKPSFLVDSGLNMQKKSQKTTLAKKNLKTVAKRARNVREVCAKCARSVREACAKRARSVRKVCVKGVADGIFKKPAGFRKIS